MPPRNSPPSNAEVVNSSGVKYPKRSALVWLALFVVIIYFSWAVHYYQFDNMPAPLGADHAGKRGFSEVEAIRHVRALTQVGPHSIGSDALDDALQVGFIQFD